MAENVEIDGGSWIIKTFTPWSDAEVKNGEGIFECTFSFSSDTVLWKLLASAATAMLVRMMWVTLRLMRMTCDTLPTSGKISACGAYSNGFLNLTRSMAKRRGLSAWLNRPG